MSTEKFTGLRAARRPGAGKAGRCRTPSGFQVLEFAEAWEQSCFSNVAWMERTGEAGLPAACWLHQRGLRASVRSLYLRPLGKGTVGRVYRTAFALEPPCTPKRRQRAARRRNKDLRAGKGNIRHGVVFPLTAGGLMSVRRRFVDACQSGIHLVRGLET